MKNRVLIAAGVVAVFALASFGQEQMGGYGAMRIDAVGLFEGNFSGQIEKMSEGVKITLLGDGPNQEDLPIQADTMEFTWDGEQPARIVMTGNVRISHPSADVRAGRADWDFRTGDVVFTGNPVMDSKQFKDMRADKMTLNMDKGTFRAEKMSIVEVPTSAMGGPAEDPNALSEAGVTDWAGLVNDLKAAGASDAPSPARQVVNQLDPGAREQLMGTDTAVIVENKGALLKAINRVIAQPGLYDADAFAGVTLSEELQAQVASPPAEDAALKAMNRALLHAAFPNRIAAP